MQEEPEERGVGGGTHGRCRKNTEKENWKDDDEEDEREEGAYSLQQQMLCDWRPGATENTAG